MFKDIVTLHLTDTLDAGGQERVVVNLVNYLPQDRCRALLCTTRRDGLLEESLAPHVVKLSLQRWHRFDVQAIRKLVHFIREHHIQILHAHGTSLFVALVASFFPPFPAVVWHIHSGRLATGEGITWPYKLVARRIKGVIAVNQALADWSCQALHIASNKVWYVPNFLWRDKSLKQRENIRLPGQNGGRIVCLANLRPVKDHLTLLHAMALVIQQVSNAHLILVGSTSDSGYLEKMQGLISRYQLKNYVTFLGHRNDVMNILEACDIGVLNSISEGFPMTLLEYGMAGLPTVATQVGQCPEVLDEGRAGILVPPGSPAKLAEALLELLHSPERRAHLGKQMKRHVQKNFSPNPILEVFCQFYEMILGEQKNRGCQEKRLPWL